MTQDEKYMHRCLWLANKGRGFVSPNPMVGAVVVHNNKIVGEGFHQLYGNAHAEVNAINSVKDQSLLSKSTLYVSLEPCSHFGKTAPCSQLIIKKKIPRVIIACLDPNPKVSGKGIKALEDAGIEVKVDVLKEEADKLNREFFITQKQNRPFIYLKWAQTRDGFIDKERKEGEPPCPTPISNDFSKILIHKLRSEVASIGIGTNTAINDNPSLTTRYWYGNNPIRVVLDRQGRIPLDYTIYDGKVSTIIFTENKQLANFSKNNVHIELCIFNESLLNNMFRSLNKMGIDSILIEGGSMLLNDLIKKGLWDEAYIETSSIEFGKGVKAPDIRGQILSESKWETFKLLHLSRT